MKITDEMKEISRILDTSDIKSDCYLIGDYALIRGDICCERIELNVQFLRDMVEKGVNVMEILDYSFDEQKEIRKVGSVSYHEGWMLQKRAQGKPVHQDSDCITLSRNDSTLDTMEQYYESLRRYSSEVALLANASQEQFDKFVKDYYTLSESPLSLEPTMKNYYYSPENGFSFIDVQLNGNKPKHDTLLITNILNVLIYQPPILVANYDNKSVVIDDIPNEIYEGLSRNIKLILDKTIASLRKVPIRKTFIDNDINNYCDMKKNLIIGGISQDDLMRKIDSVYSDMQEVYENSVKKENI